MKTVMVRYKTSEGHAKANQELVRAVFDELRACEPEGLRYASYSVVRLKGRLACAAYVAGAAEPTYFILLELEGGRVTSIRDFRYVTYIAVETDYESV